MGNEFDARKGQPEVGVVPAAARPPRRKRGRKPRTIVSFDSAGKPVYYTSLEVHAERIDSIEVLRLVGKLETESLLLLRDHAFTAIGGRPSEVCLDLNRITLPLDRQAMETLLTIGRVARLLNVRYSVLLPATLESVWCQAGLQRLIEIRCEPLCLPLESAGRSAALVGSAPN